MLISRRSLLKNAGLAALLAGLPDGIYSHAPLAIPPIDGALSYLVPAFAFDGGAVIHVYQFGRTKEFEWVEEGGLTLDGEYLRRRLVFFIGSDENTTPHLESASVIFPSGGVLIQSRAGCELMVVHRHTRRITQCLATITA